MYAVFDVSESILAYLLGKVRLRHLTVVLFVKPFPVDVDEFVLFVGLKEVRAARNRWCY
jgi:hypothetical protein